MNWEGGGWVGLPFYRGRGPHPPLLTGEIHGRGDAPSSSVSDWDGNSSDL
jgi:hypothetical protein